MQRSRVDILFEDSDILALVKPAGLPSISPPGSRARSVYDIVTDHIRRRNPKGRAAVVHRLDRDTSGVMVFAKNARAKARLMNHWNDLVATRRYVALVDGQPPAEAGLLDSWLAPSGPNRMCVVPAHTRGALRAVTHYHVLARGPRYSLVELELDTGRRHQIRVQLAAIGCPVAGDDRYGCRSDPLGRLGLHATLIELAAQAGQQPMRFESPTPDSFRQALRG
jgi:23S rRNA pseudouridine1911/1915/1917 synthase